MEGEEPGSAQHPQSEAMRRAMLVDPSRYRTVRRVLGRIPSAPRCKFCTRPFAGPGGFAMRLIGYGRWAKNSKYCTGCFETLRQNHGGAEIDCSLLFADVRGSTPMAEGMRPREFSRLMGRFYDTATEVLIRHDAIVDAFVGDEVVAIFIPALAGTNHGRRAVEAAIELLRAVGYGSRQEPMLPIGAGVNTGQAFVGVIGEGPDTELRASGDVVNTTARLASAAGGGEILIPTAAADAAQMQFAGAERRSLELKGKSQPVEVLLIEVKSNE